MSPSKIVYSEDEYHEQYMNAYLWSNTEQLHALDRNTCFFIGLSMTDPNLRRLLDAYAVGVKANKCLNHEMLRATEFLHQSGSRLTGDGAGDYDGKPMAAHGLVNGCQDRRE